MFKNVEEFHLKFGLGYKGPPRELPADVKEFRIKFMREELQEYIDAGNLADQFDALIDLVYVALGAAYLQGFPFDRGWLEVHTANMQKMRATSADQSKRGFAADVIKPVGWRPPDLQKVLDRHVKLQKLIREQQGDYNFLANEGDR